MPDRVDNELGRVSTALAEVSPPKPELEGSNSPGRRRSPLFVAAASFAVVLGVGLAASLVLGGDDVREPSVATTVPPASTLPVAPTGSVPEDHLAAQLLGESAGFEEFSAVSRLCSNGGSSAGPHTLCLVDDQGLLVVVPLRMADGVGALVRGSAFNGEISIELPAVSSEDSPPALEDLVAIGHTEGSVEVELRYNGESARAGVSGYLESGIDQSPSGTVPIPDGHVVNEVLALEAGAGEVPDLARELGFEFLCGGGQGVSRCVIWEDGVAVIIPFRIREGVTAEVSSSSYDGRLEIPFEVGEPVGVRHESGRFTILHYFPDVETPSPGSAYFPASSAP